MEYSDEEVLSLALADSEDAKNYLYNKYRYVVIAILKKYRHITESYNIDFNELEQEAYFAFSDALRTYRQDKNTSLSTFISLCIDRRLKKVIRSNTSEKAKVLNTAISLDYDYNNESSLKEIISDEYQNDPLNNLTNKENYDELIKKIKACLSDSEYEVFNFIINDFDYITIAELTKRNPKQIDNTIQRIKHKIKDIIA
ncbi:MAG: hypothetical protein NC483_01335 [Ruminococcus sp.]|nr:hypothetical protein [Ruminococcus sp.]